MNTNVYTHVMDGVFIQELYLYVYWYVYPLTSSDSTNTNVLFGTRAISQNCEIFIYLYLFSY